MTRDEDRELVDALRAFPRVETRSREAVRSLFARAERHGLAGVLEDAHAAAGVALPADLARSLAARGLAREADHAAHLAMLARIDAAFTAAGVSAVALKGALLAERLYPRPAVRPTSDLDLLVEASELNRATHALRAAGYIPSDDPGEEHHRTWGHHVHLVHPDAPPVELHFHAYRGFGRILRAAPLLARSVPGPPLEGAILRAIRVLSAEDELVYLATHAAAHRFVRLGWLYDLALLGRTLEPGAVGVALERARELGMSRPLAFATDLVRSRLGVAFPVPEGPLAYRRALLGVITDEPRSPVVRAATRFLYSVALCEDRSSARRYARDAILYRSGRAGRSP